MRSNQHRSPDDIKALHHNAQRLLASLPVIMPWADRLTFRHDQTRMRRDHAKYLSLIASITLLHQHQRKIIEINTSNTSSARKQVNSTNNTSTAASECQHYQYEHARKQVNPQIAIESSIEDVELANRLVSQVLGGSLDDLLPQTRQLLVLIDNWVNQQSRDQRLGRNLVRFTQRQLRDAFGWQDGHVRKHLKRLIELEYVLEHRTGHGNAKEYELLYDGEGREGESFLLGLVDPAKLSSREANGSSTLATNRTAKRANRTPTARPSHAYRTIMPGRYKPNQPQRLVT